jgi:hypothetical protein
MPSNQIVDDCEECGNPMDDCTCDRCEACLELVDECVCEDDDSDEDDE